MKVQVINLSNNKLPQYETPMSAGMDVRADFSRVTVGNLLKHLEIVKFFSNLMSIKSQAAP